MTDYTKMSYRKKENCMSKNDMKDCINVGYKRWEIYKSKEEDSFKKNVRILIPKTIFGFATEEEQSMCVIIRKISEYMLQ